MTKRSRHLDQAEDDLVYDLTTAYERRNFRHAYSRPLHVVLDFTDSVDRTDQSFKTECDINDIMARWERKQPVVHVNTRTPQYGDFSNIGDYQTSLMRVEAARAAFDALPSRIRDAVGNDPGSLIEFVQNPANAEAWAKLNLTTPLSPDVPAPVASSPPPAVGQG